MKSNTNIVIFVLILVFIGVVCYCSCKSGKEGYANLYYNGDLNDSMLTRPTFNSNLDPNNTNLRFDPYTYGGYLKGESPNVENLSNKFNYYYSRNVSRINL